MRKGDDRLVWLHAGVVVVRVGVSSLVEVVVVVIALMVVVVVVVVVAAVVVFIVLCSLVEYLWADRK